MDIADTLYSNLIRWIDARDDASDFNSGYDPNPHTPERAAELRDAWAAEKAAFDALPAYFRECWQTFQTTGQTPV